MNQPINLLVDGSGIPIAYCVDDDLAHQLVDEYGIVAGCHLDVPRAAADSVDLLGPEYTHGSGAPGVILPGAD